jgi:hypothetical protein
VIAAALASFGSAPTFTAASDQRGGTPPSGPQRRALLIGVTSFVNQQRIKVQGLHGPANDVDLMRNVLIQPLGVPAANIRALVDPPADPAKRRPDDELRRPTRANIEREFLALANRPNNNDQIVIFMAGHGSQQPANPDPNGDDPEPDGFDEIFLPADVGAWDGATGVITNAIVDDDIRGWITRIRNTGASVWVIFDSCHSGTMTRGLPDDVERERQVSMQDLGVPQAAIDGARARSSRTSARVVTKSLLGLSDDAGDIAAMYAANSDEKTIERRFDPGNSPVQGLFTHELAKILSDVSTRITYRELARRVLDRYRARQRFASTPTFEGGGLDREILGQGELQNRPPLTLQSAGAGRWTVDAGTLVGVVPDSILEVFPPAGSAKADASLGFVKVISAHATTAFVEPVGFGGRPAPVPSTLVVSSRARVVYHGVGDLRLKIALQREGSERGPGEIVRRGAGPAALERALANLEKETNGLAERVETTDADWLIRLAGTDVILVPAGGWQPGSAPVIDCDPNTMRPRSATPIRHFRVAGLSSPTLGQELFDRVRKIARVANLQRMSEAPGRGVQFEFRAVRFDGPSGGVPRPLLTPPLKDAIVREDEWLEYDIRNLGKTPLDVTLLYVDASFGITPVFPSAEGALDARLLPRQASRYRVQITGCPLGWESTIAIAVDGTGPRPATFHMLAQEGIRRSGQVMSPLQELLESAAFGRGAETRGPPVPTVVDNYAVRVASWRTEARR